MEYNTSVVSPSAAGRFFSDRALDGALVSIGLPDPPLVLAEDPAALPSSLNSIFVALYNNITDHINIKVFKYSTYSMFCIYT